jgi:GTPase involved in cell partitioning and DNA repair
MDVTMIGLQNAGKTSLLRVLSVSTSSVLTMAAAAAAGFADG